MKEKLSDILSPSSSSKRIGALLLVLPSLLTDDTSFTPSNQERFDLMKLLFSLSVESLRAAGVNEILCILNDEAIELLPFAESMKIQVLQQKNVDIHSDLALAAVRTGLTAVQSIWDQTIIYPFHMPFIRTHTLRTLLTYASESESPVVQPIFDNTVGFPCIIAKSTYSTFLIRDSEKGVPGILALFPKNTVDVPDSGVILTLVSETSRSRFARQQTKGAWPDEATCIAIWNYCGTGEKIIPHLRLVGDIALTASLRLQEKGIAIEPELAYAAAMLHGIAKGLGDSETIAAQWLTDLGYPEVASIVAVSRNYPCDSFAELDESAIVFWADKLVRHNRPCSIDERYVRSLELAADNPELVLAILQRRETAKEIQKQIFSILDIPTGTINVAEVLLGNEPILLATNETVEPAQRLKNGPKTVPFPSAEQDAESVYVDNIIELPNLEKIRKEKQKSSKRS